MKNDIIITGGANGIGLECAKLYKSKGYNVFVLDIDKVEEKNCRNMGYIIMFVMFHPKMM